MEGAGERVPDPQAVADEHECLTVHLFERDEVFRLMKDGEIYQSLMLAPLWRYFCEYGN